MVPSVLDAGMCRHLIRLYEAEGQDTPEVTLQLPGAAAGVESCDLLEQTTTRAARAQKPARVEASSLKFPLGHFEVATYKVRMK